MKHFRFNLFMAGFCLFILSGCQSNRPIENIYNYDSFENTADLTFSSPNLSAFHARPLMSGLAYVNVYEKTAFCNKERDAIGKVSVTRKQRTQHSKLPVGNTVILVGIHAVGATGGGLKGGTYYSFDVKNEHSYEIILKESRPFVTSFSVSIKEKNPSGEENAPSNLRQDAKNICRNEST